MSYPRWSIFAGVLCLVLSAGLVRAAEPVNIFAEQRVILQAASEAEQRRAIGDALGSVLLRVSGLDTLPRHSALTQAQREPMRFLRAFELVESDILLPNAIGNPEPTSRLQLSFDPNSIMDLLATMDMPFWGSPRPQTLVVLAAPQGDWIDVVTDWSASPAVSELMQLARAQGLPLLWPELDLDELRLLHPDDLFLGLQQPLQTMAERYAAALVLGGHLEYDAQLELWVARWQLVNEDLQLFRTVSDASLTEVISAAMTWLRDYYRAQYAIAAGGPVQEWVIQINGVNGLAEQAQLARYLLQLPGSEGLQLEQIQSDRATYRLKTRATLSQWMAWLNLENKLLAEHPIREDQSVFELTWRG